MRKLLRNCPKKQLVRKHSKDKERYQKIKHFSSLFEQKVIDIRMFSEAMSNKTILPLHGMNDYLVSLCYHYTYYNDCNLKFFFSSSKINIA